jgi:hypothetical protein
MVLSGSDLSCPRTKPRTQFYCLFQASEAWGIVCLRYEIREIRMSARIQEAMQMQVKIMLFLFDFKSLNI